MGSTMSHSTFLAPSNSRLSLPFTAVVLAALAVGCVPTAPPRDSRTFDKAAQSAITPDAALALLKEGNARFVSGASLRRDYPAQIRATGMGQYPFAAVLSCLDSRSTPEFVFDQGIGDLFVARVAGNYATVDIAGSLEFATQVAGAKLIVVLGHTDCGAIKGACDDVKLGNLTTVIQALRPAVADARKDVLRDLANDSKGITREPKPDFSSKNKLFVRRVTEANVRRTVAKLRADSPVLHELEQAGKIKIVGALQDVSSGVVTFYDCDPNAR